MAEELRGGQIAGNGAAVDRHEGLFGALAVLVDEPCDMLLAGAAGAVDQHRHVGRRHQPDILVEPPRGIAAPLDVVELRGRLPGGRRTAPHGFSRRGLLLRTVERLADLLEQLVGVDRLGHVVACTELHAAHGVLDLGIARHDDHRGCNSLPGHPLQEGDTVLVGQPHVAQHEREFAPGKGCPGRRHGRRRRHLETAFREPRTQHQRKGDIIVYDQNSFHHVTNLAFFPHPRQSTGCGQAFCGVRRSVRAPAFRRPPGRPHRRPRPDAALRPRRGPRAS